MRTLARSTPFVRHPPIVVRLAAAPTLIPGQTQTYQPTVENAQGSVVWSMVTDVPGLTINPSTGLMTWTSNSPVSGSFTIEAVDERNMSGKYTSKTMSYFDAQPGVATYYDVNLPGTLFFDAAGTQPAVVGGEVNCIKAASGQEEYRLLKVAGAPAYLRVDPQGVRYIEINSPQTGGQAALFQAATAIPTSSIPNNGYYALSAALAAQFSNNASEHRFDMLQPSRHLMSFGNTETEFEGPFMVSQHENDLYVHMPYRPSGYTTHVVAKASGNVTQHGTYNSQQSMFGTSSLATQKVSNISAASQAVCALSMQTMVRRNATRDFSLHVTAAYNGVPLEDVSSYYSHGVDDGLSGNNTRTGTAGRDAHQGGLTSTRLKIGGATTVDMQPLGFRFYRAAVHMRQIETMQTTFGPDLEIFNLCADGLTLAPYTAPTYLKPLEQLNSTPQSYSASGASNVGSQPNRYSFGALHFAFKIRGPQATMRQLDSASAYVSFETPHNNYSYPDFQTYGSNSNLHMGVAVVEMRPNLTISTGILGASAGVDFTINFDFRSYRNPPGPFPNPFTVQTSAVWHSQ